MVVFHLGLHIQHALLHVVLENSKGQEVVPIHCQLMEVPTVLFLDLLFKCKTARSKTVLVRNKLTYTLGCLFFSL